MDDADATLVARSRAGDGTAFEQIYARHAGRVYSLAYRMVGAVEAEDLVQDIFLLAHRKLGSFRGDSSLGTWLYRMATNHCLDVLRSRQARMTERTTSLDAPEAMEPMAPPALGRVSPLDLDRAIQALPPACRAAFVLHDVEGFGASGSRRGARHLGGHLEVAGAQGADADPRVPAAGGADAGGSGAMSPVTCADVESHLALWDDDLPGTG